MNPLILHSLDILQRLSLASIIVATTRISFAVMRAFTNQRKYLDFIWLIIFSFGLSKIYFTIRATIYHNPIDTMAEANSLIAGYLWVIANYIAVMLAYNWYEK